MWNPRRGIWLAIVSITYRLKVPTNLPVSPLYRTTESHSHYGPLWPYNPPVCHLPGVDIKPEDLPIRMHGCAFPVDADKELRRSYVVVTFGTKRITRPKRRYDRCRSRTPALNALRQAGGGHWQPCLKIFPPRSATSLPNGAAANHVRIAKPPPPPPAYEQTTGLVRAVAWSMLRIQGRLGIIEMNSILAIWRHGGILRE